MKAALDRPYPIALARRLRELRYDVIALAERPETASWDDAAIASLLAGEGRALVAQNVGDWLPLAGRLHGLILVDRDRYPRTPLAMDKLIFSLDGLLGGLTGAESLPEDVRWLEPPAGCPFWLRTG